MIEKISRREFLYDAVGTTALLLAPGFLLGIEEGKKTYFLYDKIYLSHKTGERHPDKPERLIAIEKEVKQADWYKKLMTIKAKTADLDIVALVQDREYIKRVKKDCESGRTRLSTGSTAISRESYDVALCEVGGVISVVDAVMKGKAKNAFCAVRPPGHHTTPDLGMGYCVFNNVAIAARYAQKKYGIERVLIADWDVHHGNGTQDIFYQDGSVFFMSTHQWGLFPYSGRREETGEGKGKGYTMNRPFPAGVGNKEIVGTFKNDLLSVARNFKPELTFISAGFDSRVGDPLGSFKIDDNGFRELTKIMLEIANIAGGGKLISVLEGGYNPEGIAKAIRAHIEEMYKA